MVQAIKETFNVDRPQIKTKSCVEIPARSLVVVHGRVTITPENCERLFDTVATPEMLEQYPELVTIPSST